MEEPYEHNRVMHMLHTIDRKLDKLMASVEELEAAVATLATDLTATSEAITAEFAKLEKEVGEGTGITPESLGPLKEKIEGLDAAVKAIVVPSN